MKSAFEVLFYSSIGAGLAMATTSFAILSDLAKMTGEQGGSAAIFLGMVACLLVGAVVAVLGRRYPGGGGMALYLRVSLGKGVSRALMISYVGMMLAVAAIETVALAAAARDTTGPLFAGGFALATLATSAWINVLGRELSKRIQILSTIVVLAGLGLLGFVGVFRDAVPADISAHQPVGGSFAAMICLSVFLFVGFEWITPLGVSRDSYRRKIPAGIVASLLSNGVVYLALWIGMCRTIGTNGIASSYAPQTVFAKALLGTSGGWLSLGLSFLASFSTFNAGFMGGGRLLYALSREGAVPSWFAKVDDSGHPRRAVCFLAAMSSAVLVAVAGLGLVQFASMLSAILVCVVYGALVCGTVLLLYRRELSLQDPGRLFPAKVSALLLRRNA